MKRSLLIGAAACALAALPLVSAAATPRAAHAPVARSDNAIVLAYGDHAHAWSHALDRAARVNRDDSWSHSLRRFRDTFD